tara:strand:+ start:128 stop:283 length:156 start_codon:yes stop_codon:yes gene_type:complete
MKLIQGGKKDPAINDQDWKFIKNSLSQCIIVPMPKMILELMVISCPLEILD